MMRPLLAVVVGLASASAWSDKYGMDELDRAEGSSWGAAALVVALLVYLHFKEK